MTLLLICFLNFKWLQPLYYFIFCFKNLIKDLTYLIVKTYVTVGYLNQSIRKFYFTKQEELPGEQFQRSI